MKKVRFSFVFLFAFFFIGAVFAQIDPSGYETDGVNIILKLEEKYSQFELRNYRLAPQQLPMLMASWLPYASLADEKSMLISWQHDSNFFLSVGHYVNNYICKTKTGEQLCRIYMKKVNQYASGLRSEDFPQTLAKHLIFAVSREQKMLDSWSSNFVMWLFVSPLDLIVS